MGLGSGIWKKPIPDPGSGSATLVYPKEKLRCIETYEYNRTLSHAIKAAPKIVVEPYANCWTGRSGGQSRHTAFHDAKGGGLAHWFAFK